MKAAVMETLPRPARKNAAFFGSPDMIDRVYAGNRKAQAAAQTHLFPDVLVVSAWQANAVAVAEFTLGQILLANKGYFRNTQDCRRHTPWREARPLKYAITLAQLETLA